MSALSIASPTLTGGSVFHDAPKSTIILADLPKSVFVKSPVTNLSIADELKLLVLNVPQEYSSISYFSVLASLQRIVIVCKDEFTASQIYHAVKNSSKFGRYKLMLSETLIRKSAHDLTAHESIKMQYEEPVPVPMSADYMATPKSTKTLLSSSNLRIDTSLGVQAGPESPVSPSITLDSYEM